MGKGRSPCCDKSKVKRGPWSPEEDLKLMAFIQNHGHANWRALPAQAGLLRCGKSCRLRWINYLRPDLKRGNITPHEEETIVKLHETYGNKWSKIASFLPGRTDNEIKNVWNTHIMKKLGIKCVRSQGSKRKKSSQDSTPSPTSSSVSHADEVVRDGKTTASLSDSKVHEMIILGEDEHGESPTPSLTSCISNVMTSKEHGIGQMDTGIDMSIETMNLDGFGALDESTFHPTHDFDGLDFWNTLALDNLCPIQGIHIEDNTSKAGEGSTSSGFGDNEPNTNNVEPENWVKYLEIELGLDA